MPPATYRLLNRSDDEAIVRVLDSTPVPGLATLTYTTRPSYFAAHDETSEEHVTLGAFMDDTLVGFAGLSVQRRMVNGTPLRVGYLSGLRVLPAYRGRGIVSAGMPLLKRALDELAVPFCLASIIDGNGPMNTIAKKRKEGYPRFEPIGRITTKLLWPRTAHHPYTITPMSDRDRTEVRLFLEREGARKNLSPTRLRGSVLIARHSGTIVGVIGLWDQTPFKQTIIEAYRLPLLVRAFNLWHSRRGVRLPETGTTLRFRYVTNVSITDDDPDVLDALVSHAWSRDKERDLLAIGLDQRDPLLKTLTRYRGMTYTSTLYHVSWKHAHPLPRSGIMYPEVALL